jgi:hypothetical protein
VLTVFAGGDRHHVPHLMATDPEEIHMNKHTDSFSFRSMIEKVFAGFAAAIIIAFVGAGTAVMCFPNIA